MNGELKETRKKKAVAYFRILDQLQSRSRHILERVVVLSPLKFRFIPRLVRVGVCVGQTEGQIFPRAHCFPPSLTFHQRSTLSCHRHIPELTS